MWLNDLNCRPSWKQRTRFVEQKARAQGVNIPSIWNWYKHATLITMFQAGELSLCALYIMWDAHAHFFWSFFYCHLIQVFYRHNNMHHLEGGNDFLIDIRFQSFVGNKRGTTLNESFGRQQTNHGRLCKYVEVFNDVRFEPNFKMGNAEWMLFIGNCLTNDFSVCCRNLSNSYPASDTKLVTWKESLL